MPFQSYGNRPNKYDDVASYFRAHFMQVHKRKDVSNRSLYLVCNGSHCSCHALLYCTIVLFIFHSSQPLVCAPLYIIIALALHLISFHSLAISLTPLSLLLNCGLMCNICSLTALHVYAGRCYPLVLEMLIYAPILTGYQSDAKYHRERSVLSFPRLAAMLTISQVGEAIIRQHIAQTGLT